MRLLNTATLQLEEFGSNVPNYAILSHTWRDPSDEVSFQDMSSPIRFEKLGWRKILKTCEIARMSNKRYAYVWVDTCCIDKISSAELTESINSMFEWYARSSTCYVYLDDLEPDAHFETALAGCKWFSRGWTLQELLAPNKIRIFDSQWNYRITAKDVGNVASSMDIANRFATITSIPVDVLWGRQRLDKCSIAQRMSWAANRQTTRLEDRAYSLLGIFDVNMPLIYGEGMKAFRRLQEEIIKRSNDPTVFAWECPPRLLSEDRAILGAFAPSPAAFDRSGKIATYEYNDVHFTVTNKGILSSSDWVLRTARAEASATSARVVRYLLFLGTKGSKTHIGIYLRKIGPRLYHRDHALPLAEFTKDESTRMGMVIPTEDYHITTASQTSSGLYQSYRASAIRVLPDNSMYRLMDTSPNSLWDATDRVFLRPRPYSWIGWPMILATQFKVSIDGQEREIVALCGCRTDDCFSVVFETQAYRQETWLLFREEKLEPLTWTGLHIYAPALAKLKNNVELSIGQKKHKLTAFFQKESLGQPIASPAQVFSLRFHVEEVP